MKTFDEKFTDRKNRKKFIRVIVQTIILVLAILVIVTTLATLTSYEAYSQTNTQMSGDKGFVALSYFGVARIGTQQIIGVERLREHLKVLKD